jgi:hypothetical protein
VRERAEERRGAGCGVRGAGTEGACLLPFVLRCDALARGSDERQVLGVDGLERLEVIRVRRLLLLGLDIRHVHILHLREELPYLDG